MLLFGVLVSGCGNGPCMLKAHPFLFAASFDTMYCVI